MRRTHECADTANNPTNLPQAPCRDAKDPRLEGITSPSALGPRLRKLGISVLAGGAPMRSLRGANCRTAAGTPGALGSDSSIRPARASNSFRRPCQCAGSSLDIERIKQKNSTRRGVRMRCGYLSFSSNRSMMIAQAQHCTHLGPVDSPRALCGSPTCRSRVQFAPQARHTAQGNLFRNVNPGT